MDTLLDTKIPRHRVFTRADGSINFRECVAAARELCDRRRDGRWREAGAWPFRRVLSPIDYRKVRDRLADLIGAERDAWSALPPSIRAAATAFDAQLDIWGTECVCDVSRRVAVAAMASNQPAVWDTYNRSPGNGFVSTLNFGASLQNAVGSQASVFEALIAHPTDAVISTLRPLNEAGAALIRNARAARAMRGRPVAA